MRNFLWEGNINTGDTNTAQFREIVIPGDVLDDDRLSDGAKILYGKIARLSYKTGFCWATNEFLGGTKTGRTAARQIKELVDAGYLKSQIEGDNTRKLYVCEINTKIKENPHDKNVIPPHDKNVHPPMTDLADPHDKNVIPSHDKNVHQTLQDSTNLNLTAAAGPPETPPDPPPDAEPAATAPPITLQELKEALLSVDKTLFLKTAFYPEAIAFMAQYGLDRGYIDWLYRQCEQRKPSSFKSLYYVLFFEEDMAEQYAASRKAAAALPQPPPDVNCPVCGSLHAVIDDVCPSCGLPKNSDPERISLFRELNKLPTEKRNEFFAREKALVDECGLNGFVKYKSLFENLQKEFGLYLETA